MPIYRQIHSPHIQALRGSGAPGNSPFREHPTYASSAWRAGVNTPYSEDDTVYRGSVRFSVLPWVVPHIPIRYRQPGQEEWAFRHGPKCVAVAGASYLPIAWNSAPIGFATFGLPPDVPDFSATEPEWISSGTIGLRVIRSGLNNERYLAVVATVADKFSTIPDSDGIARHYTYEKVVDAVRACPEERWFFWCMFLALMPDGSLRYRVDINGERVMDGLADTEEWPTRPINRLDYGFIDAGVDPGINGWTTHVYVAADAGEPNEGDTVVAPTSPSSFAPAATGRSYDPADYMIGPHQAIVCPTLDGTLSDPEGDGVEILHGSSHQYKFDASALNSAVEPRVMVPKLYMRDLTGTLPGTGVAPEDYLHIRFSHNEDTISLRGVPSIDLPPGDYGPLLAAGPLSWGGGPGNPWLILVADTSQFALLGLADKVSISDSVLTIDYPTGNGYTGFEAHLQYLCLIATQEVGAEVFEDIFSNCSVPTSKPTPPPEPAPSPGQDPSSGQASAGPMAAEKLARFDVVKVMNKHGPRLSRLLAAKVDNTGGDQILSTIIDANHQAITNIASPTGPDDVITTE